MMDVPEDQNNPREWEADQAYRTTREAEQENNLDLAAAATRRNPESQETFETWFSTVGMGNEQIRHRIELSLIDLRSSAARKAACWLVDHGYYNGDLENYVNHDSQHNCILKVVLTCYGLPLRIDESDST